MYWCTPVTCVSSVQSFCLVLVADVLAWLFSEVLSFTLIIFIIVLFSSWKLNNVSCVCSRMSSDSAVLKINCKRVLLTFRSKYASLCWSWMRTLMKLRESSSMVSILTNLLVILFSFASSTCVNDKIFVVLIMISKWKCS